MTTLRIISDLHGSREAHLAHISQADYTLQIGDLGFDYDYLLEEGVCPEHHKFIGGNHDNYDVIAQVPHYLGDYGVWSIPGLGDLFYVRGGWSIDRKHRCNYNQCDSDGNIVRFKDLWDEEEMSYEQCNKAIELYQQVKPKILISHECPFNIVQYVTNPIFAHNFGYDSGVIRTRTNMALQAMTDFHRPKLHIFGHYHKHFDQVIDGVTGQKLICESDREHFTRYICMPPLGKVDIQDEYFAAL